MAPGDKKHFIPLESDPELFTELIHRMGMSSRLTFHDLLTLSSPSPSPDEVELLSMIPRPVLALIIVTPGSDGYCDKIHEEEDAEGVQVHDQCGDSEDAVFYKQTIGNACGMFAVLHSVSNGAKAFVEPNTFIANLISTCAPLNVDQRVAVLESSTELEEAHASVASRGQTAPPPDPTIEADFSYMAFTKGKNSGKLYLLEGCRKGPVDLGVTLEDDEDLLTEKALSAVRVFVEKAGRGQTVGYNAMALSVTGE
ncbi:ubiquitin C-terminal hydrolase L3 [Xylariaceae sp. FL0255]|nr:ubiquitin C-terminal hydrolase L3 [Xylariaceae sp. FL0255]